MTTTINASTAAGGGLINSADASGILALQTAGVTAVTINASQNVGVGTSSPGYKLSVQTTTGGGFNMTNGVDSTLRILLPTTGITYDNVNGGYHAWQVSGAEKIRLDTAGNVGIGTNSPTQKLDVRGYATVMPLTDTGNNAQQTGLYFGSGTAYKAGIQAYRYNGSYEIGLDFYYAATGSGTYTLGARIDSSGNLLVGTTSSGGEIGRLTVKQGADADSGGLRLIAPNSTNAWAPRTGSDSQLYFGYNGTSKAKIDNSTGAYSALSDARLKENVTASVKGLDCVIALEPVTYFMVGDESNTQQLGFIAQAVESIVPEVVSKPSSANEYYGLNYSGFVPVLVKAIQEQQALITTLTERITALEAK